jgi:hypothetical protein
MVAALVGLAAGSALVLAHGGNALRTHACIADSAGHPDPTSRLRIVGANDCQVPFGYGVDWNIRTGQGDAGPHGPQGATGSQGPAGPAGNAGAGSQIPVRIVVAISAWAGPGSQVVEARCRPTEFAVGGGWRAQDPSGIGEFKVSENRPLDEGRGWRVRADGWYTSERWQLVVHAACAPRGAAQ